MTGIDLLTKDDIQFLTELANELKTQDTLGTAKPVFWQVQETEKQFGLDPAYAFDIVYLIGDAAEPFEANDIEEAKNELIETYECKKDEVSKITDEYDLESFCMENGIDFLRTGTQNRHLYHGAFLTRKGVEEHLKINGHNYSGKIIRYCNYAHRNPQLERLLSIVEKFADVEAEKPENCDQYQPSKAEGRE